MQSAQPLFVTLMVALCALAAVPTQAQNDKSAPEATPKQTVPASETDRYKIEIKIDAPSAPGKSVVITIREQFEHRTMPRQSDGSQTFVDTFTAGTVSFGGNPQDILKMLPVVTVIRDKSGKFSSKAEGGSAEGNPEVMGVLQQFAATATDLLPAKSARAGDRWKVSIENANTLIGGSKLTGEAEEIGSERIDGEKTVKVAFKFYEHQGDAHPQGEGTVKFSTSGHIVHLFQKGRGIFAGAPANVEIDIHRIAPDTKK